MKILITGAAGYLGQLLVKNLSQNKDINAIFALDKKLKPKNLTNPKICYLKLNLAKDKWEKNIPETPDIIIHFAFDIKSQYGKIKKQKYNNIFATERVLKYCFKNNIKKLIYSSSVAAYGAKPENIGKLLKEISPLAEEKYPYGMQKKEVEELINKMFLIEKNSDTQIFILRITSVNGPEGEKRKKIGLLSFIKRIFPILPITHPDWARQYVHEEDVVRAIEFLIFKDTKNRFEIFNLAPSDFLTMQKMANLLHKKTFIVPSWFIKPIFFLAWHLSIGRIPTVLGSERFFIYPINVDGSKITNFGFQYKYNSKETFLGNDNN